MEENTPQLDEKIKYIEQLRLQNRELLQDIDRRGAQVPTEYVFILRFNMLLESIFDPEELADFEIKYETTIFKELKRIKKEVVRASLLK